MKTSPSPPIKYSSVGSNWPHTDGLLSIQENETYSASEQFSFYSILRHCAMYNTIYTVYYIIQQVKGPTTHNISTNIPAIYLHYKTETSNSQTSDAGKVNSLVFCSFPNPPMLTWWKMETQQIAIALRCSAAFCTSIQ